MKALISEICSPEGSYLSEFLLNRGYEIDRLGPPELEDVKSLAAWLADQRPDEIYCLSGEAASTLRLLEAIRSAHVRCRTCIASSSAIYGSASAPQSERTACHPETPEARASLFAHRSAANYRESYGLHICCGVLFHHDSPRSRKDSAARAITRAVARMKHGLGLELPLDEMDVRRDWGYTPDYVRALWLMLQHDVPADYVIGTGEAHTVREFAESAFAYAGLNWRRSVTACAPSCHAGETGRLRADASKARRYLGWQPSLGFEQLVRLMVNAELAELRQRDTISSSAIQAACAVAGC